ncbi:MAG: metal-dependent hydrolase [Pseudomonadota bacterium]
MTKKNRASTSTHDITPRKVAFDWSQTPLHWIPGQPYESHMWNAFHLMLPVGEFAFCRIFNQALPYITDDKLRADVQGFIRQEAMHARAHDGAAEKYLAAHGVLVRDYLEQVNKVLEWAGHHRFFSLPIPEPLQKQWLIFQVGVVAAAEHFTCVVGKYMLENEDWEARGADAMMTDLLRWHGAEEVEHRSVAFDLYRHLGGTYPTRYYLMLLSTPLVLGLQATAAVHLMKQDPALAPHKPSLFGLWFWREWQRSAKKKRIPGLGSLLVDELRYLMPWYNPAHEADTFTALAYLARSPGVVRKAAA